MKTSLPIGALDGPSVRPRRLSDTYESVYRRLLEEIAAVPRLRHAELCTFWPKVGARYDGDLMVVGRAVNGWIDRWVPGDEVAPDDVAKAARVTGEGTVNDDPLGWVLDRWKKRDGGYDTSASQFWETIRRVVVAIRPDAAGDWPSRIAWTNLAKVAPWHGGNPGSVLLTTQRARAAELLALEIEELRPRRVVAFTGRWWFELLAPPAPITWGSGLVEGAGKSGGRCWVVAVHPMTRSPSAVADAVLDALDGCATLGLADGGGERVLGAGHRPGRDD